MDRLIAYLRENMIVDFHGDLSVDGLRVMLADDSSPESVALLAKVADDRGVNDLMIILADCLLDNVLDCITDDAIRQQLARYGMP